MNTDQVVQYWLDLAEDDWPVIGHLLASGDCRYALFFGHLYLEKLLKALVVQATGEHAPRVHNLLLLAERAGLAVPEDKHDVLLRLTGYSIETRYPEERAAGCKRYTRGYVEEEIKKIEEVAEWLKSALRREKK